MKILYLTDNYSAGVQGVKKSLYDELLRTGHEVVRMDVHMAGNGIITADKLLPVIEAEQPEWMWVVHSWTRYEGFTREDVEKLGTKILGFGLSDPRDWDETRTARFTKYSTNDLTTWKGLDPSWAIYTPPSCDPVFHRLPPEGWKKDNDVLFYGLGNHPMLGDYRVRTVKQLKERLPNVSFRIHGNGWPAGTGAGSHLIGQAFLESIWSSKVGIDITRHGAPYGRRNFEVPGCGTPIIRKDTPDTRHLFEHFYPLWPTWRELDELVAHIEWALELQARREWLGINQHRHVVRNHSVTQRVTELLRWCHNSR